MQSLVQLHRQVLLGNLKALHVRPGQFPTTKVEEEPSLVLICDRLLHVRREVLLLLNRHTNGTESVNPRYFPKKAKFVSKKPMFIKIAPFGLMATISISMGLC
jgi:hypothetical protein